MMDAFFKPMVFCQSCAMPMREEDLGSNADGTKNEEYCRFCFQNGAFTEPDITVEEMVLKCATIMREMGMEESDIERITQYIPTLKRWKKA